VFLVQKEVALRIARDKKESLLSLSVKVFGKPAYIKTIGRGNFSPAPRVDSAIIAITDISRARFENASEKTFFELIHYGFASKRKQLLGNLTGAMDREALTELFNTLSMPLTIRAEDVPLELWLKLTCKFQKRS
jgi:16S rRNA (adenine1518-N6/adenine1519-N6)-dimethyltransferase